MSKFTVTEARGYKIKNVSEAKMVTTEFLKSIQDIDISKIKYGLPEVDDRFNIWRVPLKARKERIGEIVINAYDGSIDMSKTTALDIIISREKNAIGEVEDIKNPRRTPTFSNISNMVIHGDSRIELQKLPEESVNLIFTSPPYYNAKPEYSEYTTYEEYLELMRQVIAACSRVLSEGRFFVINVSPVLMRRASRSESSKRIAVPFDLHQIFVQEGFDFIDDIHWIKPEGAGWSLGRGRRFAADRNPLQYKPVPVTEYILVYRKSTDKLIDWNIRKHKDQQAVAESKVEDDYEKTNLWRINPSRSKHHPATFPVELAERVIKYYSFKGDVVLDPFAGTGTTAKAAMNLGRRFVMCEIESKYVAHMNKWMFEDVKSDIS